MNIFLCPATWANANASLANCVSIELLREHLSTSHMGAINDFYKGSPIHCWALTENCKRTFDQMNPDDVAFFFVNELNMVQYFGKIAFTFKANAAFGKVLWEFHQSQPWEYLLFLYELTEIRKQKDAFLNAFGVNILRRTTKVNCPRMFNDYRQLCEIIKPLP